MVEWTQALSVGDAAIDAQHQELFRRAERLIAALRGGDRSEVGPLVLFLERYAADHFADEERLMESTAYPGLDAHRAAHEAFRRELRGYAQDFERKGPTPLVSLTLHNWLSDWLRKHVSTVDQDLGRHLAVHRGAGSQ